ncbi:MAG: 3-hydroxy-3-methylglutaryl-CoA reductase [Sphingobacteriales bacterium]|nr:MAG: 3-hydroxy-3-methylglutaryl-CoA reductase [Sphingobacteriales bacterium]
MATHSESAKQLINLYTGSKPFEDVLKDIAQKQPGDIPPAVELKDNPDDPEGSRLKRIQLLAQHSGVEIKQLTSATVHQSPDNYRGNIENYIGITQIPTGLAGPFYINGTAAQGDFYIPLATTEAALIASYSRGAKATRLCGGITSVCTTEGLQRSPLWKFESLVEVGQFCQWFLLQLDTFKQVATQHSRHAQLKDVRLNMEGNNVLAVFEYTCGEAAGQNMATICTEAICQYIIQQTPVTPICWFVESNYSGDKKATTLALNSVRGKKVTTEALLTRDIVNNLLKTTPEAMATYWQSSMISASQSGSIGLQGHIANGLTALFLACGQDVACVSEAYVGITRMEVTRQGDLYVAVTLPSLVVGTIGGGTSLPTQSECLQILGCQGEGSARKFAEICGALALAGEVSIAAALAAGHFSNAHQQFRKKA